uniref:Regulatory protein RecX n=1 Tax=Davidia involucrata TaxID=16924 RepID=A0A5B7BBY1_DAVIN
MAGNLVCKTSFGLQCRVLVIPWVKKSSCINCSKGRAYNSSFPVRYIPKKSSKTKEPQNFMPVKGLEDKELRDSLDPNVLRVDDSNGGKSSQRSFVLGEKYQNQNQNRNQRSINYFTFDAKQGAEEEIGHDLGVVDHEFMEEPEEVVQEFEIHQGMDPHHQDALPSGKTKQDAEKLAIELLAARASTAVGLRKKLHGKKFPLDIVDAVIVDFQSRGLINDCLYAETFSRSRWSSSSWGPRRIKQALFKKGVSEVDAEKAIKLVFEDGDSGGDQESRLGLSKLSMDHLFVQSSKQWLRARHVPTETRKLRIIRWLQYRGFNWGVINFILKKLESEYSP